MPKYRIISGDMDHVIETPYRATPAALSVMALSANLGRKLGRLLEISGAEFNGENTVYVSTESVLANMGMMPAGGKAAR